MESNRFPVGVLHMVRVDPHRILPSSDELPCSDDTPVDNVDRRASRSEDQNFIPNLLLFLLESIWATRNDWFFGADMGVYHTTGVSPLVPIVPDGFLSLGVERRKGGESRKSYVLWEENNVAPILALEVVSLTPGGEYEEKLDIYTNLGVLHYVIYNPRYWRRDGYQPFEVYKLVNGAYQQQIGEPFWMPELGLGIGRGLYTSGPVQREVLYWFDAAGQRLQTADERATAQQQRAEQERQRAERLAERLRQMGIDPDEIEVNGN